ncbi:single-stranded-DNA-specific exonuclease RecJ [Lichenihabitans sp. PAMC28606]|uniref:single-stranded-DNA-specific exonuclease RecJ n=1 Tax=Lichenihabitans sp. PAMC28606 TaxID=2880932 RepID=UPI001D0B11AE|nr:single-stranded-DNA-specific exonuclease RecJ [Lichenihabitans sp. PAMC28606]UDL95176.1 single-stranded-DNA-specific exonuclease RecJ [Lichenihabitans sp. PAMC28606]
MSRAFLGVEHSMLGRAWRDRLAVSEAVQADAIRQTLGLSDLLSRVVAARGQTAASAPGFLAPSLREAMPDPNGLSGMEAAVERLAGAVVAGEAVAIFGDYDVDGACSAALLSDYLTAAGLRPAIHIPDRILEGYGPNIPAIQALKRAGADLLVTVDCGTTSTEPLEEARRLGLDCVVIDHHQAPLDLPPAQAIVNPNRQDDLSGLGHLCAAGVVFMVLVALHRDLRARGFWAGKPMPDLLAALDLVALATVADVVPLVGLNRAFVAKGLAVMRLRARPGLAALFDIAGTEGPPTAFHLGFLVGPRINAGGRIGDAALGARLLLTRDPLDARRIAEQLDQLNRERRSIEASASEEAEAAAFALAETTDAPAYAALVTSGAGWHPGVVGLVASRLRERYERPAFAISLDGLVGTGSGRSIPGVDLGRIVRAAVETGLLIKGGGHAMAAGITIEAARIDAFRLFLHEQMGDAVALSRAASALEIDAALSAAAASIDTIESIETAGPFGSGNPEPVFAFPNHRLTSVVPVGTDHLRLTAAGPDGTRLSGIAFRAASSPLGVELRAQQGRLVHLAGTLTVSRWGGSGRAELRVMDAAVPEQR